MRVLIPTIEAPWRAAIAQASSFERLSELRRQLARTRVLDPACGCGNFLYQAYRAFERIEERIRVRTAQLFPERGDQVATEPRQVTVGQFYGIDIDAGAIDVARAVMSLAQYLSTRDRNTATVGGDVFSLNDNFQLGDALIDGRGNATTWPPAEVIVGNPPFLGAKRLKPARGADYVVRLRAAYPDIPGMVDYCVYWFRRAHDHLPEPTLERPWIGRAGLVGTQNIRSNQSRAAGLDYITRTGTIVDAVTNHPWAGDAHVHVSIVNWMKSRAPDLIPQTRLLRTCGDSQPLRVAAITSALGNDVDVSSKRTLPCNQRPKRCFQGKIPGYEGFVIDEPTRQRLLASVERDAPSASPGRFIRPYLTGRDLLGAGGARRYCIDFGNLELAEARAQGPLFEHCREHVLPAVMDKLDAARRAGSDMASARARHGQRWWQLWNRRDEMSAVLAGLDRYIGCSRVSRRPIMTFVASHIVPSDLIQVFAFADDYSFGILQSRYHWAWWRQSSRLKIERDVRYSVRAVFETFPWPQHPTRDAVAAVAEAARDLCATRARAMRGQKDGLRGLYRTLDADDHTSSPLRAAHIHLDEQVRRAYGFATSGSELADLLALNRAVFDQLEGGRPVLGPGLPDSFAPAV